MPTVFILTHTARDAKLIGVFTSRVAAETAIRDLSTKNAFRSGEWSCDEYVLDRAQWEYGSGDD